MKTTRQELVKSLLDRLSFELSITTDSDLKQLLEDLYNFMWAEECNNRQTTDDQG